MGAKTVLKKNLSLQASLANNNVRSLQIDDGSKLKTRCKRQNSLR